MKKILLVLVISVVSHSSFAQPAKSKGITDCNELKFWMKALQTELQNIDITFYPKKGVFDSKRKFNGFDDTEFSVYKKEHQYHVRGIINSFQISNPARIHFKKMIALVQSCDAKFILDNSTFYDNENKGYCILKKSQPNEMIFQIELKWDENALEDAYPSNYLLFTIYYSKEIKNI